MSQASSNNSWRDFQLHKPITIGVELEFTLATVVPGNPDPEPDDPRPVFLNPAISDRLDSPSMKLVQECIVKALRNSGVVAYSLECRLDPRINPRALLEDLGYSATHWVVKSDSSIGFSNDGYYYYGIEICSPILEYNASNMNQIAKVCDSLYKNFRVNVNETCGLHVHVGQSNDGFDLHTLRNLAAVYWCFEEQLNQIHPLSRLEDRNATTYYPGLEHSDLGRYMNEIGVTGRSTGLDRILKTMSRNEVIHLMSTCDRGAVCFDRQKEQCLDRFGLPEKKTIEFRAHEGCLDPVSINHWIGVCEGLVRFSRDASREDMERICKRNVDRPLEGAADEGCSLWKVLVWIGCREEADFYSERRRRASVD